MSATNRGAGRVTHDVYPTPAWCTRRILEALTPEWRKDPPHTFLEPCCGEHAITAQLMFRGVHMIEIGDIRSVPSFNGIDASLCGFQEWDVPHDVVITNPPFNLAPELIRHFLPRCDWLVLLLRASFRLAEWRHDMPDEYKLPERPSFCHSDKCTMCKWRQTVPLGTPKPARCPARGCGWPVSRSSSDAAEYSWFVWTPERGRPAGLTRVLPDTPEEERLR